MRTETSRLATVNAGGPYSQPHEPAKRPRRRPGENRALLVSAAVRVFAVQGYAGARTATIASKAGIPQPHVYANFLSKRELFLTALRKAVDSLCDSRAQGSCQRSSAPGVGSSDMRAGDATSGSPTGELSWLDATFSDRALTACAVLCLHAVTLVCDPEFQHEVSSELQRLRTTLGPVNESTFYGRAAVALLEEATLPSE